MSSGDRSGTVWLPASPGLGALYATGAGRAALGKGRGAADPRPPATELRVAALTADAEHLTRYQHLLGERASDQLPAGFVHALTFPVTLALMVRPEFPFSLLGMLHLANHVTQHRPVVLGEALDVSARTLSFTPHHAGVAVVLEATAAVGQETVWRGVSTYLAKGARLAGAARPERPEREEFVPPVPTARWELPADTGKRYAAVSGDHNPIHTNVVAAKALGFPRRIAHGMYTASRALAAAADLRGDAFEWSVEFAKPVLLPGSAAVRVAPDGAGAALTVWHARSGKPHLTGRVDPLGG